MNKSLFCLSALMGIVVLVSNYLVQFPVNYYGLENLLIMHLVISAFLITDSPIGLLES